MPFIGNQPAESYASFLTETFTVSATASYTLSHAVANENEIRLVINGVVQQPGSGKAYTASGTTLTLSSATVSGDVMYAVYLGRALQTVNPPNASVGTAQLADSSVTSAKLASGTGGKILQVSSQVRNTSQQTIATTTYTDLTSLSIAITPSSTSSKILLKCFVHGVIGNAEGFGLQFLRDSTSIVKTGNTNAFFAAHQNGATDVLQIVPFHFIDSPSTTSEVTYKVQAATRNGNAVVFNDGYHSNFYLMEIAG